MNKRFPYLKAEELEGTLRVALALSHNLQALIDGYINRGWVSSQHDFSKRIQVPHSVISGIISGNSWANMHTVAHIELMCGQPIYPRQKKRRAHHKPEFLQVDWFGEEQGYNRDPDTLRSRFR